HSGRYRAVPGPLRASLTALRARNCRGRCLRMRVDQWVCACGDEVADGLGEGADPACFCGCPPDEPAFPGQAVPDRDVGDVRPRVVSARVGGHREYALACANEGEHLLDGAEFRAALDGLAAWCLPGDQ